VTTLIHTAPRSLAPIALAAAILLGAWGSGLLQSIEFAFRDARAHWFAHTVGNDVAIVEIDTRTMRSLDRWPWSRNVHAELIRQLNQAKPRAVLYDIDLSAPSADPSADAALAAALSQSTYPIVLPAFRQTTRSAGENGYTLTKPLADFTHNARVGLVDPAPASDGLVRGIVHADEFGGETHASAVSLLSGLDRFEHDVEYPIDYSIAPESFPRVSYLNVADGDTAGLAGKTVFVGATAAELHDMVDVPVYGAVPRIVMQAIAYASLRDGAATQAPGWVSIGLALLVCLTVPSLRALSWRKTLAIASIGGCTALLAAIALDCIARLGGPHLRIDVIPLAFACIVCGSIGFAGPNNRQMLRAWLTGSREPRHEGLISGVLSASIDGIVVFDHDGIVRDANAAGAALLGWDLDMLPGQSIRHLLPGLPELQSLGAAWSNTTRDATPGDRFELNIGWGDSPVPVEVSITRVNVDEQTWFTVILRDVTERKQQHALLKHQATHDALTGLPNRVMLGRALEALRPSTPAALFMLDLDRFKDVNDVLGHATGDAVLTILGQRLRSALPEQNLIARIGGDEFAVVVPDYVDMVQLHALAEIVLERVRSPIKTGANTLEVGASIGIALCPEHGTDGPTLLQHADVAMYVAKNNRTSIEFYNADTDQCSLRDPKIAAALRSAIGNGELELFYQPKVRLSDLKCIGVEALARWTHPHYGAVLPAEFIPLAEESNLIAGLTRWSLVRALEDHLAWRRAGLDLDIAVNLSARHLRDTAFAQELLNEIESRVDPSRVELEIAETALMSDPEKAAAVLHVLTRAGVRIAMDDFGTGFSSLAYLKHLNIHTLKIDRSFIKDIANDPNDLTIVRSTLRMAHGLDLTVVAEGIEEREHHDMLRDLGCDIGQGYWIAQPMPADKLLAWSQAWERGRPLQLPPMQAAG
jgi:diguanylate cyclase (GGDEF)-like protein/PAS domain S-box-containing protein